MRQGLDLYELDRLMNEWNSILQTYPEAKGSIMERIGTCLLSEVRAQIAASGMKNGGGPLPGWQGYYVGSRHGYAAVRAVGSESGYHPGAESPGAITNYAENGHRIRKPKQTRSVRYRYRPRIKVPAVQGYHFYHNTKPRLESLANEEIRRFVSDLARRLGGAA